MEEMLLTLFLSLVNAGMSFFANYVIRFSALDLAPISTIILVARGHSVFWSALILVCSYAIIDPKEFRFLWITLPMAMFAGWAYTIIPYTIIVLLLYHLGGFISSMLLGYFNPKYAAFMVVNFSLNYVVGKLYILLFL